MMLKMFEIHRQKQAEQREEENRSAEEQAAQVSPQYWKPPICYDDDEECSIQMRDYYKNSPIAIASDSPITDSLITEDEHLNTILKMKSDEVIKSSVEDLVQTPSESEDLSDIESECDVPVCDNSPDFNKDSEIFSNPLFDSYNDSTSSDDESFSDEDVPKENFKIYSNPLFDEEIISTKIDPHHFNAESDLIESLLNKNTVITSPKIDFLLEEFAGELTLINPIPLGITETNFDPKEDIRLIKKLLYDNSSPRPPEELNSEISDAMIESFSSSPIPVKDSDSLMEEIDIFLAADDSIPPGIDSDGYDSEEDIFEEPRVHMPNVLPTHQSLFQSKRFLSLNKFSISFISDPLSPVLETLLPFSSEIEDKVFKPGILVSKEEKSPHDFPDYEDSRARGFGLRREDEKVSSSHSTSQNLAFLSSPNTSSLMKYYYSGDFGVSACLWNIQDSSDHIDEDDLEELDLRCMVAMLTVRVMQLRHMKWHFARECRSGRNQGKRSYGDNAGAMHQEMNLHPGSGSRSIKFLLTKSDEESTPANDRFSKVDGYHAVPPPINNELLTSQRADISLQVDKVIIKDWNSDDEDDVSEVQTVSPVPFSTTSPLELARTSYTVSDLLVCENIAPKIAQSSGAIRPIYLRMDNLKYTTVGTRAVVNTGKGKMDTDLKKSRWVWRPKGHYLDHVSKDSGFIQMLNEFERQSRDLVINRRQHQMTKDEQVLHDELENMIAQEVIAKALDDAQDKLLKKKRGILHLKRGQLKLLVLTNLVLVGHLSMIGSLMYLTASRYLKHQPKLGLWYPKDSPFELEAFSDSDYGGSSLDRKSTIGGCQFLGKRLISWQCKKQTIMANSTTKAEYVAAANYCGLRATYDAELVSAASLVNTARPTLSTARLSLCYSKVLYDGNDVWIGQIWCCQAYLMPPCKFSAARQIWCCQANLVLLGKFVSMANLEFVDQHNMVACLEKTEGNSNFHEIVDFLASSSIHHALTVSPPIYTSYIEQFWNTASSQTVNDVKQINAIIDSKAVVVTEASIRSSLLFNNADGTACLTNEGIF
ncbi:hypothetical protein Tco_0053797 [Tanacetum coccineum]